MATLFPGQSLHPGQSLQSNNKLHTLIMQTDGNVVLYDHHNHPLWATKSNGITPREFIMQMDGNLVLYDTSGSPKWDSKTDNNPGAFLNVQDDGNLVVYRAGSQTETADNALWAAGSNDTSAEDRHSGGIALITIDTSEAPDLKNWIDQKRRDIHEWYDTIAEYLRSEGYTAPQKVSITFKNMDGVAFTSGTSIVCSAAWFKAKPDDQGAIIHELVHVVQQYKGDNPSWLVEGIADYIRWFLYEPPNRRPHPNLTGANYTDSYQTTASFLDFAKIFDKEIVVRMNAALRQGRYAPSLWQKYTGKTIDQLWTEYIQSAQKAR
ncbi:basic secretory protein-like protein [Microcystis aeruginosa]|jgi:hypothetical protein|uniref:basic secretory protein-like protein n=1 Tax=Microcystis aeruginosa TaxID=1126 RepID=UPI00077685B7|nr:basic secretory protein-like protein [Microcystis aeruginosa]BCU10162.1 hypothetical protein MAN88_07260 [Microcystis aeruginosa]